MIKTARIANEPRTRPDREAATTHARQSSVDSAARTRGKPQLAAVQTLPLPAPQRIASVDALRGFTMFWILGGDALAWALMGMSSGKESVLAAAGTFLGEQLSHVDWAGVSFYDLIFPTFIFVVGVSIAFSLPRLVEREGKAAAHRRVITRSLLLFALGVLYYGGMSKEWPDIRLLGVLQRIALCYLFASLLFLNVGARAMAAVFAGLLVGYWALMSFVPVPGIGTGSFEQGANLANWIDANYLPGRKWVGTWDPEGLLSTLPAIATCLLGVFAGLLLKDARLPARHKTLWLLGAGGALIAAGFLWGLQFPVIKQLWTSSFVLVAGGFSLLLLGLFHYIVDVRGRVRWSTIFLWIGANAITLYLLNTLIGFDRLARRLVGGDVGSFFDRNLANGAGDFLAAAVGLALAVALAGLLYRRKIFLRV